ncbi:5-oxoprolinase subunit PxpA [Paraburkholderia sediminicola]|uniref:5-oxoprolinase subunit PxpA n=1 Tax=Paraburkholderia sediminicola TaxID=458836 RepID=UPI0038B89842
MRRNSVDLNSDMGEGFGVWSIGDGVDEAIMPQISSANIAAGFHAGDPCTIARTVAMARDFGVAIGVHPGYRDLVGFGRRAIHASAEELVNDVIYQCGALREFARLQGLDLSHVKLHGALYMHAAVDEAFATGLVRAVRKLDASLPIYCMAGSVIERVARTSGHPVVREFYADRDYDKSGSIVFSRRARPLEPREIAHKVLRACIEGRVVTTDGRDIAIEFESVCVHSDTPHAVLILTAVREILAQHGIAIQRAVPRMN